MTKRISVTEARRNLPGLVREAESGKIVELTRRGQPVAVLIGRRQYERLTSKSGRFSEAYAEFNREVDLKALDIDPDGVFAGARDRATGSKVESWT